MSAVVSLTFSDRTAFLYNRFAVLLWSEALLGAEYSMGW